ncbi:MAG TPA: nucleotide pyrophosphatase/phosphodiesterase family protein [Solirubrobacteraceae bacterium]|jgi:hypothetical protein|nr:nucleotide pyrophosphatase/phosphodiesterase family protein [Solirubrobacteraceae bacterium]
MRRIALTLTALWLAALAGAPATPATAQQQAPAAPAPKRVYVLVLDGLRPRDVRPEIMPMLSALRAESTWYDQARSVLVAETIPNHVAMMTGELPRSSGIPGNRYHEPDTQAGGNPRVDMSDPALLGADTLVTRLERACGPAISTATVQSKTYLHGIFRGEPFGDPARQLEADHHWDPRPVPPQDEHTLDARTLNDGFLPWMRTAPTPQFAFVNLGDIDRSGHADEGGAIEIVDGGPFDRANFFQRAAMADTDELVQSFVQELKSSGVWDETVLIITSDHGMDWSLPDHVVNLGTSLKNAGFQWDRDFYIVNNGAADMVYVKTRTAGALDAMVEAIKATPGVDRVLTDRTGLSVEQSEREHPRALYGLDTARAGDIVALAQPGYRFSPGPSDQNSANPIPGNHGHTITQRHTLMVTGGHPSLATVAPGLAAPSQFVPGPTVGDPAAPPVVPDGGPGNLSIAPTVAALLGLGDIAGGYDAPMLSEAFDDSALAGAQGICEGLGRRPAPPPLEPSQPPPGGGAAAGAGGGAAQAGGGGAAAGRVRTTLSARRRVAAGRPVALSGRIEGDGRCAGPGWVRLYRRRAGRSRFDAILEVPAGGDGRWRAEAAAGRGARFVALPVVDGCESAWSAPVDVAVRPAIALDRVARCAVRGRVAGGRRGTRVALQRRQSGRWVTVARGRLDRRLRFALRPRRCRAGAHRVLVVRPRAARRVEL